MTDDAAPSPAKRPRRRSRATTEPVPPAEALPEMPAPEQRSIEPALSEPSTFEVVEDGAPIQADRVDVRMGAVGRVDTRELHVTQGAVGGARAEDVTIQQGALGGALAGKVTLRQSVARSLLAREAVVEQSFVRTIVAAQVRVEKATGVGILIARQVSGDVKVLVDWRAAAAFGAAFGLLAGLVRLAGRRAGGAARSAGRRAGR